MYYKIGQLILTPGRKGSTTSDIYIAQPDAVKESLAGKLFILIEIESKRIDSLKIINFIIDNISHNYYQNEKIILREKISGLKVEHIFEAALAKTNSLFSEFIYNEKIKISLSAINITAGVLHDNMLYFANTGKNRIFLLYKNVKKNSELSGQKSSPANQDEEINNKKTEEYVITDVAQQAAKSGVETAEKGKLFTNVVSGQIPPQAHFFPTSEAVPEYISPKQIIDIITALPPLSAVEQMKTILAQINAYVSFLGIIIKSTVLEKPAEYHSAASKSTSESIINLNATETNTENLLTPSGVISLKKWPGLLTAIFNRNKGKTTSAATSIGLKDKVFMKKNTYTLFKIIGQSIKYSLIYGLNIFFYLLKTITQGQKIKYALTGSGHKLAERFGYLGRIFLRLNYKGRVLLVFLAILIIALVFNLTFIKKKNLSEEKETQVQGLATLIEQKQNQADANLLYSNEEGANKLFTEIATLLDQYPQETDEQKQQLSVFREKFEAQLEKIRHISKINDPAKLADFSSLNSRANPGSIIYLDKNKRIYAADAGDKSVYILNTTDNLVTTLAELKLPITELSYPVIVPDDNIYYFNRNSIIALNTQKEILSEVPPDLPASVDEFRGADIYGDRYYLLSATGSQIFRFSMSGGKISGPANWLQENIDLGNTADMAIDGHVYVLNDKGEVWKLLRGQKAEFSLDPVDPPFSQPVKISVSPEKKFIYILEPANQRLVLYDKSGQFLMQYQLPGLQNLKDFFVDEKNKIIYFLNLSSVYSINATHFED